MRVNDVDLLVDYQPPQLQEGAPIPEVAGVQCRDPDAGRFNLPDQGIAVDLLQADHAEVEAFGIQATREGRHEAFRPANRKGIDQPKQADPAIRAYS